MTRRTLLVQIGSDLAILGAPGHGRVGQAYAAAFRAHGLIGAGTFAALSLPAGLSLTDNLDGTADVTGTPTTAGEAVVRLTLRDAQTRRTVARSWTITITREVPLAIVGAVPREISPAESITAALTASGVSGTASWAVTSDFTGAAISAGGTVTVPEGQSLGAYSLRVRLRDSSDGATVTRTFPVDVAQNGFPAPNGLWPSGYACVPYLADPEHGEGWGATGTSLMQYDPDGAFPAGLTLAQSIRWAVIAGLPPAAGSHTLPLVAHAYDSALASTPQSSDLALEILATPTGTVWDMRSRTRGNVRFLDPVGSVPLTVAEFDGATGHPCTVSALTPKTSGKHSIALKVLILGDRGDFSFGIEGFKYVCSGAASGAISLTAGGGPVAPNPVATSELLLHLDADAELAWFSHNGTVIGGGDPETGTGGISVAMPDGGYVVSATGNGGALLQLIAGDQPYGYAADASFPAWAYVEEQIGTLWDSASRDSAIVPYGWSRPSPPLLAGHVANVVNLAQVGGYTETHGSLAALAGYATGKRQCEIDFETGAAATTFIGLRTAAWAGGGVHLGENDADANESVGMRGSDGLVFKRPATNAASSVAGAAYGNGVTLGFYADFTARTLIIAANGVDIDTFDMSDFDGFGGGSPEEWFPAFSSDGGTFRIRGADLITPKVGYNDWTQRCINAVAASILAKAVLWADMLETSGSIATEEIHGNHGTYPGSGGANVAEHELAAPIGNHGKQMVASSSGVGFPHTATLAIAGSMSVCGWFKDDGTDANMVFFIREDGFSFGLLLGKVGATVWRPQARMSGGSAFNPGPANIGGMVGDGWHFWCYVRDGSTHKTIIDAVDLGSHATAGGTNGSVSWPDTPDIGWYWGGSSALTASVDNGAFSQALVFNGALTQAEIDYLYNAGLGRRYADVVAEG